MRTVLLLGSWMLLLAAPGAAQDSARGAPADRTPAAAPDSALGAREVPRVAREVIDNVLSPYCPGLLLANCPSAQADSLRKAITERARGGESRASIEADLLAWYGESVRAAPLGSGLGLAAWFTPGLAVLLGGIFIALWLRRRTASAAALAGGAPAPGAGAASAAAASAASGSAARDASPAASSTAADAMTARIDALVRDDSIDED